MKGSKKSTSHVTHYPSHTTHHILFFSFLTTSRLITALQRDTEFLADVLIMVGGEVTCRLSLHFILISNHLMSLSETNTRVLPLASEHHSGLFSSGCY
jgi:hypothetical protein